MHQVAGILLLVTFSDLNNAEVGCGVCCFWQNEI